MMQTKPFVGILIFFSHVLLLICQDNLATIATATATATTRLVTLSNETDQQALLDIKDQINADPFHVLDSWNSSLHFCRWQGVNCGKKHRRVTSLNLASLHLSGTLSPHIGNLSFLREIDLGDNNLRGIIPPEIGRLARLQHLVLANNSFHGIIPSNFSGCFNLETIDLLFNSLHGQIPAELGSLPRLTILRLAANNLTGSITPSLGNLSLLSVLSLARNNLEGGIPDDLGRLSNLEKLQLFGNKLSGNVPTNIYNISSLYFISVAANLLQGQLPLDLGLTLPNLQQLFVGGNQFYGPIPESLANASGLTTLDISGNHFSGPPPLNLGNLQYLNSLNLNMNPLFASGKSNDLSSFFSSLTNCTMLTMLQVAQTNLTGDFPHSVTNLSTKLSYLRLVENSLSGNISWGIGNLVNLAFLRLDDNNLSGVIPDSIGKLTKLQQLTISMNKMSGKVPASIGNITSLGELDLSDNMLEGNIPSSLANCKFLQVIDLTSNKLTGEIPKQVVGLSSLSIGLFLGWNRLTGSLPLEVGNLISVQQISMPENEFSGEIPGTLGSCLALENVNMGGNHFEGTIPSSFQQLRGLQSLNLSHNNLSGNIPQFLENFSSLSHLDLSYNDFDGQVPKEGIFVNDSTFSIAGNKRLCGGIHQLQLPPCSTPVSNKQTKHISTAVIAVPIIGGMACVILLSAFLYLRRRNRQKIPSSGMPVVNQYADLSYHELVKATNHFSSANLIGKGSFGSVYKGTLNTEELIAVKVFNLNVRGADKSFLAECEALKNIRHRNLVKIISCCSSIDFKGHDFKALVYEFLPNGNLDSWLHSNPDSPVGFESPPYNLNLIQRLNIAVDIANALEYLHHHCQEPVAHCDLKPSNILLDRDLVAHVGDFGLARLIVDTSKTSQSQTSSTVIRGTIGYVAPEYGTSGEVSVQGDVYSYGVLLLEMILGKRPTDGMFNDRLSLHGFVEIALLNDRVIEIIDPWLMHNEQAREEQERISGTVFRGGSSSNHKVKECLASILRIGLMCSVESPRERMDIRDALKELQRVKMLLAS